MNYSLILIQHFFTCLIRIERFRETEKRMPNITVLTRKHIHSHSHRHADVETRGHTHTHAHKDTHTYKQRRIVNIGISISKTSIAILTLYSLLFYTSKFTVSSLPFFPWSLLDSFAFFKHLFLSCYVAFNLDLSFYYVGVVSYFAINLDPY